MVASDSRNTASKGSLAVGLMWPSLALGALVMLLVLFSATDPSNLSTVPLGILEYFLIWMPFGFIYGALVWALSLAVRVPFRRRASIRAQRIALTASGCVLSGAMLFAFFSLFPFSFPTGLFALVVALTFLAVYSVQAMLLLRVG